MREIQMEAQGKKDRKREAVRGERQLDLGEDVGNEAGALSWAAASQHRRCEDFKQLVETSRRTPHFSRDIFKMRN